MNELVRAYVEGFVTKCAEAGVDPEKLAQAMTGAGSGPGVVDRFASRVLGGVPIGPGVSHDTTLDAIPTGDGRIARAMAHSMGNISGRLQNADDARMQTPAGGVAGALTKALGPVGRTIASTGRQWGGYYSGPLFTKPPATGSMRDAALAGRAAARGLGR